jgi:hypothetical protein
MMKLSVCTLLWVQAALTHAARAAWTPFADTTLNVSQIAVSQPETRGIYLGSPSLLRLPSGALLASHDLFGPGTAWGQRTAFVRSSSDGGQSWSDAASGAVSNMYWATLFRREADPSTTVFLFGVSNDGNVAGQPAQAAISRSVDGGATWSSPATLLTNSTKSFSTGPTPIVSVGGRLWRALEHNVGAGWGAGYSVVVMSCAADAPDLLDPAAWVLSGELPFAGEVASRVPPSWARTGVTPSYGWLEGNAVDPGDSGATGIRVMLRVNSLPAANKAALVSLAAPTATPQFMSFVDFPGGMTKFTVRRDAVTGLFATLSNNISDDSVSFPPSCAALAPPTKDLPCCGFLTTCVGGEAAPTCLWCHAVARNVLTLAVSASLDSGWRVVEVVLADDTGTPAFLSELLVGFQYVDWQFEGEDIIFAVRAAYRGANQYHNANRHFFGRVTGWRAKVNATF